jgi:hypothetical protein
VKTGEGAGAEEGSWQARRDPGTVKPIDRSDG